MRRLSAAFLVFLFAAPALGQPTDPGGISTPVLSTCLARITLDGQGADSAYAGATFDGLPWLKVETVDARLGSQTVWMRAAGSGTWWLRDGKTVPLRFACDIDRAGKALKLQASPIVPSRDDPLPPHRLVTGTVIWPPDGQNYAGGELRLQLLDESVSPPIIVAEQVMRQLEPSRFVLALRLPAAAGPAGRKLNLHAIVVQGGFVRRGLRQPRPLTEADLQAPIMLHLE